MAQLLVVKNAKNVKKYRIALHKRIAGSNRRDETSVSEIIDGSSNCQSILSQRSQTDVSESNNTLM